MSASGDKADLQRDRILQAAQRCFVEHGFHAATMASIAATADVSAGLIYRYFASKNEVIVAIIERQLALLRAEIQVLDDAGDLSAALAERFGAGCTTGAGLNAALVLELSAAATRDPAIAAAVHEFDTAVRKDVGDWFARACGCSRAEADAKALALQFVVEGMRVREAREPTLDRERLKAALDLIVPALTGRDAH